MKRFLRLLNAISFAVFMISSNQVLAGADPNNGDYINDILAPQLGAQYYQPKNVTTGGFNYEQAGFSDGNTANWMGEVNISYTKTCTSSDPCDATIDVSTGDTYGNLIVPDDYDSNKYLGETGGIKPNTIRLTTTCSNTTSGTCEYTGKGIYLGPVVLDTSGQGGELRMEDAQSLVPIYRKDLVLSLVMDASGTFKFNGLTSDTGVSKEGFVVDSVSSVVFNNGSGATVNPALQFYQFTRAVKVNSATSVTFNIEAQFYNNASDLEGVGLYVAAPGTAPSGVVFSNEVIFNKGVFFDSNTSTSTGGGAVHNLGTISVLNGSEMTLSGNSAVNGTGGGLYNEGTVSASGALLASSNIANAGGAIYNTATGSISVSGTSNFTSNISASQGGAIYNAGTITLSTVVFGGSSGARNTAQTGGAIYNTGTMTLGNLSTADYLIFSYNTAGTDVSGGTGQGGAIYNAGNLHFAVSPAFSNNQSAGSGAGVYNAAGASFEASSVYFSSNASSGTSSQGGGLYNAGTFEIDGTSSSAVFSSNTLTGVSSQGGGFYNASTGVMSFVSLEVSSNQTSGGAGGFYNEGTVSVSSTLTLSDNDTGLSSATQNGGGLYNLGTLTIGTGLGTGITHTISSNGGTYTENGGGLYNAGTGTIVFNNKSVFTSNYAAGNGGAIYNASSSSNVNGVTVSLNESSFTLNTSVGQGGAIYTNAGTIAMTGNTLSFVSNQSGLGGAIYNASAEILMGSSSSYLSTILFDSNKTTAASDAHGGAIINEGDISLYSNTITFTGNESVSGLGGAIYNTNSGNITLSSTGATNFLSNSAEASGGAIYNNSGVISLSVLSSTFYNNSSVSESGGAIYNASLATFNLTTTSDLLFSSNSAFLSGGALYNAGTMSLTGAFTFLSNTSNQNGGAIYNATGSNLTLSTTESLVFEDNASTQDGGALYNAGNISVTDGSRVSFKNNTAISGSGGAIYNSSSSANLVFGTSNFSTNTAQLGGAVYNDSGTITFGVNSSFSANGQLGSLGSATQGGAIYNSGSSALVNIASGSVFSANISDEGMAIYNTDSGTVYVGGIFDGSSVSNRGTVRFTAHTTGSGTIYNTSSGSKVYLVGTSIQFTSNSSSTDGDDGLAIYNGAGATISTDTQTDGRIEFTSNANYSASGQGGAIYNAGTIALENVSSLTFSNNIVGTENDNGTEAGGAIYNTSSGIVSLKSATFTSNISYNIAGAIYNVGTISFSGANTFTNNLAQNDGGVIYNASLATFSSTGTLSFTSNASTEGDGAVFYNVGSVTLKGAIFSQNSAVAGLGGAIYNTSSGSFILSGGVSTFYGNSALQGGAIYNTGAFDMSGSTSATVYESNSSTSSTGKGGAFYNDSSSTVNLGDVSFKNNTSAGDAGAIYTSSSMTIGNSIFYQNKASAGSGGALYIDGTTDNISVSIGSGAIFSGNEAISDETSGITAEGGAIYISGSVANSKTASLTITSDGTERATSSAGDDIASKPITFSANEANGVSNAIYMGENSNLTFTLNNNGTLQLFDPIVSAANSSSNNKTIRFDNLIGESGDIYIEADQSGYTEDVQIAAGNFILRNDGVFFSGDISVSGSGVNFDLDNDKIDTVKVNSLDLSGNTITVDINIDFVNETVDHFELPSTVVGTGGVINVSSINAIQEQYLYDPNKVYYLVQTEDGALADSSITVNISSGLKVWAPIYNYDVVVSDDGKGVSFTRSAGLNTYALRYQASILGSYANTQLLYDLASYTIDRPGDFFKALGWVKPFMSDEDIELTGHVIEGDSLIKTIPDLKLKNKMHGVIAGMDLLTWVWGQNIDLVMSGTVAYGKSSQEVYEGSSSSSFSDYDLTEMMVGLKGTFYLSRLFISAGVMFGESDISMNSLKLISSSETGDVTTDEPVDDFKIQKLTAYAKTGVTIDIWHYATIQPSVSYIQTNVMPKNFEADSSSGSVEFEDFNVTELSAEVRMMLNTNYWKPFVTYKSSSNLDKDDIVIHLNDILLPVSMEYDDYSEVGIGVAGGKYNPLNMEFLFTKRTGGREGWGLSLKMKADF